MAARSLATVAARRASVAVAASMKPRPSALMQGGLAMTSRPTTPAFSALAAKSRSLVTTARYSRDEVVTKLDAFHAEVMSANWADYLYLVYNVPFWEAELEELTTVVQPYLHENVAGGKFSEVQELMDVYYKCEDVRDHLNELAELCTRASGLMGTGFGAGERVENMDENAHLCGDAYDRLLADHPAMKPKIEQTVGHGLAILRSKHKFKFSSMHRYFY